LAGVLFTAACQRISMAPAYLARNLADALDPHKRELPLPKGRAHRGEPEV